MDADARRALEAAYRAHAGPLLGYLRAIAPAGAAAEDLLQETFFRAFRSGAPACAGSEAELRAFLVATARNIVRNERRDAGRRHPSFAAAVSCRLRCARTKRAT